MVNPTISLIFPILHEPSMPPIPAKKNKIAKTAPRFLVRPNDAAAVAVGKTIDRKSPERGRKNAKEGGRKMPALKKEVDKTVLKNKILR